MLDTRCSILDGRDLFPLRRQANPPTGVIRKEPVLSETEGGLGGCRDGPVGRLNIKKNRAVLQT